MTATPEPYLTATGNHHTARFYVLSVRLGMREGPIRRRIVARARLAPGRQLLDIGCGTGTQAILAQRLHPDASVVGLDGDPAILAIARRKAERARVPVRFDEAMAYALPYADASIDAVTATLMLHHLTPGQQARTLAEVERVLRPGGRFVVADFAPPHNRRMQVASRLARHLMRMHGGAHGHGEHGEAHAPSSADRIGPPADSGHPGAHPHHPHPDAAAAAGIDNAADRHGQRGAAGIADSLLARGWRLAGPTKRYMTFAGTLAIVTAIRPALPADSIGVTAEGAAPAHGEPGRSR